jgi:cell division septation protein DedD
VRARFFVFAVIVGMAVALFVNGLGTDHRDLVLRQGGSGQALDLQVEGTGPPTAAAPGEVADVFTGDLFPALGPLSDAAPAQIVLAASVGRVRRGNGGGGGHASPRNLVALLAPLGGRGGAGATDAQAGRRPLIDIGPSPTTTSTTVAPPADTTTTTKKPRPPKTTTTVPTTTTPTTTPTTTTPPTTTTEPTTTTTEPTTTTTESTTTTTT